MSNYYYLIASLPLLHYDKPAGLALAAFIELCERLLVPRDWAALRRLPAPAGEVPAGPGRVWRQYQGWDTALRNELVLLRAAKRGKEAAAYLREQEGMISLKALARRVFEESSPLLAEEIMDRARWDYLSELEAGHYFDLPVLVIYYLKLKLLERKAAFNIQKGTEAFSGLEQEVFERLRAGVEAYGK